MKLRFLVVAVAIVALFGLTAGSALARPKTQPPVLTFAKTAGVTSVPIDGSIPYTVSFKIGKTGAKDVVIEDLFLHGIDLPTGATGILTGPNGGGPTTITPVQTAANDDRNVYEFRLGDLAEGSYTLTYTAIVIPGYYTARSATGKYVMNEVHFFAQGKWKAKSIVRTPLNGTP